MKNHSKICGLGFALMALLMSLSCQRAMAQPVVLDDSLFNLMDRVITLNESHHYLDAYRAIAPADNELDRTMRDTDVSQLNESDFELLYWPIKKSRAEVAYKLGLYNEMAALSAQLDNALEGFSGLGQAKRDGMRADILKIDGGRFFLTQNYSEAVKALREALAHKAFDPEFTTAVRDDLAQVYYAQGDYARALAQLDTLLAGDLFSENHRFRAADDERLEIESQRALCLARMGQFGKALDIITPIVKRYKAGDQRRYAEALRKQGKILMLQYDVTGQYNDEARQCYRRYLSVMKTYVDTRFLDMDESEREQFWLMEQPFVTDCYRLEDKDAGLLYDVSLFSKAVLQQMGREFSSAMTRSERQRILAAMRVDWRDVQRALPRDGAAIEFVNYLKDGDREHLGALLITKASHSPVFIPIAPVDSILDYRLTTRQRVGDVLSSKHDEGGVNALYTDPKLSALIWNATLVEAIGRCSEVYFAPDGVLHTLALEYLVPDELNGVDLYRVTSTRMLTQARRDLNTDDMLLCGNVDFSHSCRQASTVDNDALAYSLLSSRGIRLQPLVASIVEVDSIRAIRGCRETDKVLQKDSVGEVIVRRLMQQYHLLHFATHGESVAALPTGNDLKPAVSDTQLSQSCLFLSGAMTAMREPLFDASQPDGILSARELAGMDLSNVDLAVLSACLSGRGQVSADGVYGLQRGFKAAGARALIVSLWEVDDYATNLLMRWLYANLEKGMTLHEAFVSARASLRDYRHSRRRGARVSTTVPYSSPNYSNAFILIDGI